MANPSKVDLYPAVLAASTTMAFVELNPDREYTLLHEEETVAGVADSNTIYFTTTPKVTDADAVVADATAGDNKMKLQSGRALVFGPKFYGLQFKTAAGAPTFTLLPGMLLTGRG